MKTHVDARRQDRNSNQLDRRLDDDEDQREPAVPARLDDALRRLDHDEAALARFLAEKIPSWQRHAAYLALMRLGGAITAQARARRAWGEVPAPRFTPSAAREVTAADVVGALGDEARLAYADALATTRLLLELQERDAGAAAQALLSSVEPHVRLASLTLLRGLPGAVVEGQRVDAEPSARAQPIGIALAAASQRHGARLYRDAIGDRADAGSPAVSAALARRRRGEALPDALRAEMERRFGVDFGGVRVHTDEEADTAATAISARAFTLGEDIFLSRAAAQLGAHGLRALIAHELAHVVQGRQGRVSSTPGVSQASDPLEHEARAVSERVVAGGDAGLAVDEAQSASVPGTIHRDDTKLTGLDPAWFTVDPNPLKVNISGELHTAPVVEGYLALVSPDITYDATVTLNLPSGSTLGEPNSAVKVGPVQTLMYSMVMAIYLKSDGGKYGKAGRIWGRTRDVEMHKYANDPHGKPFITADPPFYDRAETLNMDGVAKVHFEDRVSHPFPTTDPDEGGKLVGVQGSSKFNSSVGIKRGSDIITMAPFGWSLSWYTDIADSGDAKPDPAWGNAITLQKADKGEYVNTKEYADQLAHEEFETVDEARTQPSALLVDLLPRVRARNPHSGAVIAVALRLKNPDVVVDVELVKAAGDKVNVSPTIQSRASTKTKSMDEGDSQSFYFALTDLVDPTALSSSDTLDVFVSETKTHIFGSDDPKLGGTASIPHPFRGSAKIDEGADGTYKVTTRIASRRRDDASGVADPDHPAVVEAMARRGGGEPLPEPIRIEMAVEAGADLGRVRVHTDHIAAAAARALLAEAFTVGDDVFFAAGQFQPGTPDGRRLLAHELTHVRQAQEGRVGAPSQGRLTQPGESIEREAEAVGQRAAMATPSEPRAIDVLQRMEGAFRTSFGGVRLRTDEAAQSRAASLETLAYTEGDEVGFAAGAFEPDTQAGLHVIAHELAHVAQQRGGTGGQLPRLGFGGGEVLRNAPDASHAVEADAHAAADAIAGGRTPRVASLPGGRRVLGHRRVEDLKPGDPPIPIYRNDGSIDFAYHPDDKKKWSEPTVMFTYYMSVAFDLPKGEEWKIAMEAYAAIKPVFAPTDPTIPPDPEAIAYSYTVSRGVHQHTIEWCKKHEPPIQLKSSGGSGSASASKSGGAGQQGGGTGGESTPRPIPVPVQGQVQNMSGDQIVPNMKVKFQFLVNYVEVKANDILPVPWLNIQWTATRTHDAVVDGDGELQYKKIEPVVIETEHCFFKDEPLQPNDDPFDWKMGPAGRYEISARVDHRWYLPATHKLAKPLDVEPENYKHNKGKAVAFNGTAEGDVVEEKHSFDVLKYGDGKIAHGQLTEAALAITPGSTNITAIDGEISDLETTIADYEQLPKEDPSRKTIEHLQARIEKLKAAKQQVLDEQSTGGMFRVWGQFTSRTANITGGSLRITGWMRKGSEDFHSNQRFPVEVIEATLLDTTQLYEPRNYTPTVKLAKDTSKEKVLEELFLTLEKDYPDGTMSLRMEVPDSGGKFVEFTRNTDTVGKDIGNVVFSEEVGLVVNVATTIMSCFPPTAAVGVSLNIAYNAAATAYLVDNEIDKGPDAKVVGASVAQLAVSLIPVVSTSSKLVTIGTRTYMLMEGVALAGGVALMYPGIAAEIASIRETKVKELMQVESDIRSLRNNSTQQAKLEEKLKRRTELQAEIRDAWIDPVTHAARNLAIVAISGIAAKGLSSYLSTRSVRVNGLTDVHSITSASESHVPVGTSRLSEGEAVEIMGRLKAGDREAFSWIGIEALPKDFDPRSVGWAMVELPDGSFAVVKGDTAGIDPTRLPRGAEPRMTLPVEKVPAPPAVKPTDPVAHGGTPDPAAKPPVPTPVDTPPPSAPVVKYASTDPVKLEKMHQTYPTPPPHGDDVKVYRYAATKKMPPDGISYWQTDVPNPEYQHAVLMESTVGELKKSGEVLLDPLEMHQDPAGAKPPQKGNALVVIHNADVKALPGTAVERKVIGWTQIGGKPVFEGDPPPVANWRDNAGKMHFPSESAPAEAPAAAAPQQVPPREVAKVAAANDDLVGKGLTNLDGMGMSAATVEGILAAPEPTQLPKFLRAVADPGFNNSFGAKNYLSLTGEPKAITFAQKYGGRLLGKMWRKYYEDGRLPKALKNATNAIESAPDRQAAIDGLVGKDSTGLDKALGLANEQPKKPSVTKKNRGVDRSSAEWESLHDDLVTRATADHPEFTPEQIATWADMKQTVAAARRGKFGGLEHKGKLELLDAFDKSAKDAKMPQSFINALRGDLSEWLFNPDRALTKPYFKDGEQLTANATGATIPDYSTSETGVKEWVNQKSDLIDSGQKTGDVYKQAVAAANNYRSVAVKEAGNIPKTDKYSIDFIREPNPATIQRMLEILFGDKNGSPSPIYRVKIGTTWYTGIP